MPRDMASEPDGAPSTEPPPRVGGVQRFKNLVAEWGSIAIVVYFTIFVATIVGFASAMAAGVDPEGTGATLGLWGAAWLATKATQPLRIAGTALLTPVVGAAWHRTPWGRRNLERRREREAEMAREAEAHDVAEAKAD